MNELGLIETVGADIPRFDHEYDASTGVIKSLGLLVEEARTNIHENNHSGLRGSGLSNGDRFYWDTNSADEIAPDGINSSFKVYVDGTETNPGGSMYVVANGIGNNSLYTTTNIYTSSVFIKPILNRIFRFDAHSQYASDTNGGNPANISFYFDLSTPQGEVTEIETPGGLDASVTAYPNGWYKCTWTYYRNSSNPVQSNYGVIIYPTEYGGNATTGGSGTYFYVWGPQVEQGTFPTSYIPTSGGTATRNPDNVSMEGDNFSDVYNQEEGSYKVEGVINGSLPANTYGGIFGAGGGSGTSNFIFYNPGTSFGQYVSNTGQSPASFLEKTYTVGSKFEISASYATNDFACSLNGDISSSTTSDALYKSHTYFRIGSNPIAVSASSGVRGAMTISNISYYSKQITDTQLQNLTK